MKNPMLINALFACCIALSTNTAAEPAEYRSERREMVENQIVARGITNDAVIAAMRTVPRHLLIPEKYRRDPYGDHPIPIGYGQTISQPYIVAYMTRVLDVEPGDKVLEVGTGSGYQAAVLAEITPNVYSIEIVPQLADHAKQALQQAGYEKVTVRQGDGYYGWEEKAPWDAIVVTAAAGHIPPPLVQQLRKGGRMVIPVGSGFGTQYLLLVEKNDTGEVSTRNLMPVRFVPFTRAEKEQPEKEEVRP
ncbi:MAG TPA: protein-L-isoaspartate(D-aspartate) O-methyltransferase [Tichowtungia sp.]|nr:protein-L-isoaspartate(D-aspartate) O-methyltransferase [Tichowtungia sp.]